MIAIDTGAGGGSKGPWISFKPKGSAKHGLPYKSWALRTKTETDSKISKFEGIEKGGIVLDIYVKGAELCGSLKLGWAKSDGESGKAPERRWWPSVMRSEPRPDESKTAEGGFVWRNALSIRCAIGGGNTATWEDEGWGGYKGFSALVNVLNTELPKNEGLCPLVRCTGYLSEGSGNSSTFVPVLEVVKWVPRPECLKEDAPQIAQAAAPAPAPAPAPASPPAATAAPASGSDEF
jgi:hypothetical protein